MDAYEDLLKELGEAMNIELKADEHNCCLLTFGEDELKVQLEPARDQDYLLIATHLGELPAPGPYRNMVMEAALKANALPHPRYGTMSISVPANALLRFDQTKIQFIKGDVLHAYLQLFCKEARLWRDALKDGKVPEIKPL